MHHNNIKNIITVAALPTNFNFDSNAIRDDENIIYVEDSNLIRLFSQAFQVSYKILLSPTVGNKLSDGNWTGLLGLVKRSEADLALGRIELTEERLDDFSFSYPYTFSEVTFITEKPKAVPSSITLLAPFSFTVWIALTICILSVSFVLFLLAKMKESYKCILFKCFCSLLEKSIRIKSRRKNMRFLIGVCLLFVFVVTYGYKSVLLPMHSVPLVEVIRNISDLVKAQVVTQ